MSRFVSIKGVRKKLGVIFRIRSPEGGTFIITRVISKPGKALAVEYEVKRKVGNKFRLLAVKDNKLDAIAFARGAIKAIKLAKEAGRVAKKAGVITGAALVKAGKIGFRFIEEATRPKKRAQKKAKKKTKKGKKKKKK